MQKTQAQSPDWEDPPGEGNGNPCQYACLENFMDSRAWWVHGIAKELDTTQRLNNNKMDLTELGGLLLSPRSCYQGVSDY